MGFWMVSLIWETSALRSFSSTMSERISLISERRSGGKVAVFCWGVLFFSTGGSLDWTVFTLVTRDGAECFFFFLPLLFICTCSVHFLQQQLIQGICLQEVRLKVTFNIVILQTSPDSVHEKTLD